MIEAHRVGHPVHGAGARDEGEPMVLFIVGEEGDPVVAECYLSFQHRRVPFDHGRQLFGTQDRMGELERGEPAALAGGLIGVGCHREVSFSHGVISTSRLLLMTWRRPLASKSFMALFHSSSACNLVVACA